MHRRALWIFLGIALGTAPQSRPDAQVSVQATQLPTVSAENESWYLNGGPIAYAGNLYYPAGAQVYFNANEMVRSGFYMGVPLYTRTTLEPFSVVFVPLAGGRLQPYARPRTGELTGTAGSTPGTLPTPPQTVPPAGLSPQAAGAPSETAQLLSMQLPRPAVVDPVRPPEVATVPETYAPRIIGTVGRAPLHTSIGGRPQGTNSMFIEYAGQRWSPKGSPQAIDVGRLTRLDDFKGFAVWGDASDPSVIHIPVIEGSSLAVAYTRTPSVPRVK